MGVEMMRNRAETGLKPVEINASFGLNGSHNCRKLLPRKARKILATPGVSNCNDSKQLRPIMARSGCQNDVNLFPSNGLWKQAFLKNAGGHYFTKYNRTIRSPNGGGSHLAN
jgi:hypothetical protein